MYDAVPVGTLGALEQSYFIEGVFAAMTFGITLAWPFVVVNLIYNIGLGFINKAMPQLMVAFVGAPFMVGAGLILLTAILVTMLTVWTLKAPSFTGWL